ncbi:MAG: PhaM family polyhydroxyalkanoate granule multifunctional regulatory protein [Betaproteobacteria bacterium]
MSSDSKSQGPKAGAGGMPFSPQDAMEFMQKMWNPLGVAMPGFGMPGAAAQAMPGAMPFPNPAAMFAALDPVEIERKIAELKVIENWLTMSVSMMQMSIKTMELQKASVEAMRGSPAARK